MVYVVGTKNDYSGTLALDSLNVETTVVEIDGATDDYTVEGYIDLGELQDGDVVIITEYIAVDGTNFRKFVDLTVTGAPERPIIRFHAKNLLASMKYKVTINQIAGTPRSFPYGFVQLVLAQA
jgi:hypothetical protein